MTLDGLLARIGVGRGEAARFFSSCTLALNTLYVGDVDDFGVIQRCYQDRLRGVVPGLSITFKPHVASPSDVPSYIKKSQRGNYVKHHAARATIPKTDMFGSK